MLQGGANPGGAAFTSAYGTSFANGGQRIGVNTLNLQNPVFTSNWFVVCTTGCSVCGAYLRQRRREEVSHHAH